jgi:hypothetical protein
LIRASGARISREHLSDESLGRAVKMLSAQLSMLGTLTHRYREEPEVTYELGRDDDALCDVLGILLGEQRSRRLDDAEAAMD